MRVAPKGPLRGEWRVIGARGYAPLSTRPDSPGQAEAVRGENSARKRDKKLAGGREVGGRLRKE